MTEGIRGRLSLLLRFYTQVYEEEEEEEAAPSAPLTRSSVLEIQTCLTPKQLPAKWQGTRTWSYQKRTSFFYVRVKFHSEYRTPTRSDAHVGAPGTRVRRRTLFAFSLPRAAQPPSPKKPCRRANPLPVLLLLCSCCQDASWAVGPCISDVASVVRWSWLFALRLVRLSLEEAPSNAKCDWTRLTKASRHDEGSRCGGRGVTCCG